MLVTIGQKPESNFDDPVGMLRDCHTRIIHFLNTLAFAAKNFRGLPLPQDTQSAALNSLGYFREAAPRHNADEEQSLFPRVRTSIRPDKSAAVLTQRLEDEHRWAQTQHEIVDALFRKWISNVTMSADENERLISTLSALQSFYAEHIQHEELTIFPLAEEGLSTAEIAAIGGEMAARRGVRLSRPA